MEMRVRVGAVAQGLAGPRGWAWASLLVRGDGDEGARGRCCAGVGVLERSSFFLFVMIKHLYVNVCD
jgi:hypothetical protein